MVGVIDNDGKVTKVIFETTPAWQTASEMTELVEWTKESLEKERFHPLLIIANFIIEFLKIHPFEDGNGRLSRVLTNLLLLKFDYVFVEYISHEQIIEKRKDEYYLALRSSQQTFKTEKETISPWLNFFLSVVKDQATKALKLVSQKHEDELTLNQQKILEFFENRNQASPLEISNATGILIVTVRKSLEKLLGLKKVKRVGKGRATRYYKF